MHVSIIQECREGTRRRVELKGDGGEIAGGRKLEEVQARFLKLFIVPA
jgi:hypothetical protein